MVLIEASTEDKVKATEAFTAKLSEKLNFNYKKLVLTSAKEGCYFNFRLESTHALSIEEINILSRYMLHPKGTCVHYNTTTGVYFVDLDFEP